MDDTERRRNNPQVDNEKVAVKIVDDRGIESVKIIQPDVTIGDSNRRPGGPTP